jgi:hypothetical protein
MLLTYMTRSKCLLCFYHVDVSSEEVKVMENLIHFIPVEDYIGQGLSDCLIAAIDGLNLHIIDCRGRGYDMQQI